MQVEVPIHDPEFAKFIFEDSIRPREICCRLNFRSSPRLRLVADKENEAILVAYVETMTKEFKRQ